ncbi:RHS repeat-associated core domain-containing protein [Streptomyces globisporus]|uniref:RHS repeat-associated core domain-containing protein n=1 Tax=Streptomyces globisporus TaxID=1908 RepID=UPI0036DA3F6E
MALADEAGAKVNTYAYSPRGVQRAATTEQVPQPYRFAGGYQDPTGLYHFAARYYDPNIGRFTTPDPSGQEQNPYLYAAGDPVNKIDPTGLLGFGSVVDGLFGAKDVAEIWQNRNDPKALVSQAVGIAAGAVFGGVCVAGTSTMATAVVPRISFRLPPQDVESLRRSKDARGWRHAQRRKSTGRGRCNLGAVDGFHGRDSPPACGGSSGLCRNAARFLDHPGGCGLRYGCKCRSVLSEKVDFIRLRSSKGRHWGMGRMAREPGHAPHSPVAILKKPPALLTRPVGPGVSAGSPRP